ncbi:MAG TPA: hypothetical protein VES73_15455 [Lamprocystis sp. (in: g-proteobacteria)]|nr:hypothetical protein [Lamprocystis sp. (in: g-proteobacteria)]
MRAALSDVLEAHSAGSPTDPRVCWTDLKPIRLAQELVILGVAISRNTAAKLLAQAGLSAAEPA